ncbi:sugar kinase [Terasakiella sp. SH-1]|uniref:sugar kinase n=1 Tax=Terasakiella sp. SH-1 TaxID=2560057 RepID=UPI00197F01EC|nr:sugar kinase [Terasakiella sp. SH-1]
MQSNRKAIACIGECMVELSPAQEGLFKLGFAGDTYTTAVYLKRQFGDAVDVSYITALGVDPQSKAMVSAFEQEGIDTSHVRLFEDKAPGLYLIENDETGERYFQYWRSTAAARFLYQDRSISDIAQQLEGFDLVYVSGISLAVLDAAQRTNLIEALKANQADVAFDPNFRAALWPDLDECRQAFQDVAGVSKIVFVTPEDDCALWGEALLDDVCQRWSGFGAEEVVVKDGANGCLVVTDLERDHINAPEKLSPVDTTGAGDSFSSGYLGARLQGGSIRQAAEMAHRVAAQVIMHPGGIIPQNVWQKVS